MSTDLVPSSLSSDLATLLHEGALHVRQLVSDSTAKNSSRAYESDWRHFTTWAQPFNLATLPASPETVSLYLAAMSKTLKPATIKRRLSTIALRHKAAALDNPAANILVQKTMKGVNVTLSTRQKQAKPITLPELKALCATCDESPKALRDRALLLLGFSGAFRRSELAAIQAEHITRHPRGLEILVPKSKTDQKGEGETKNIPKGENGMCPVEALKKWMAHAKIKSGPIFLPIDRHGKAKRRSFAAQQVDRIIKERAALAELGDGFSGHSLRSGFATAAAQAGVEERHIMEATGHKSSSTVRRYIRESDKWKHSAAAKLGL